MNRREYINRARALALTNRRYPDQMTEVSTRELDGKFPEIKKRAVRGWRSRQFTALLYEEANGILRLSVNRAMIDRDGHWLDGIIWDELQVMRIWRPRCRRGLSQRRRHGLCCQHATSLDFPRTPFICLEKT